MDLVDRLNALSFRLFRLRITDCDGEVGFATEAILGLLLLLIYKTQIIQFEFIAKSRSRGRNRIEPFNER
jgi:hypothetical protein